MHGVAGNPKTKGPLHHTPVVWFVDIFGSSRRKETKKKRKKQHRAHAATELLLERMRNAECALVVYSYENKWAYT